MAKFLWTQRLNIGPAPRLAHAMAYDAARKQVVLFGGTSGELRSLFADTWVWDGDNWTQASDIGPGARASHAMAYDERRARVVLFGGQLGEEFARDTWEWDGDAWTQIADTGPAARSEHALAYHAATQRTVLFGGSALGGTTTNDTWTWDGDEWTQQEDTGPAPRRGHCMAADAVRNRVVLFGGTRVPENETFQDTWEWDGTEWTPVAGFGPAPAVRATMAFMHTRTALYGGAGLSDDGLPNRALQLTWEWNGKRWVLRQDIGPGPRFAHAMAFDRTRGRLVLFGGLARLGSADEIPVNVRGDTWEHLDAAGPAGGSPGGGVPGEAAFDLAVQPAAVTFDGSVTVTLTVAPRPETLTGVLFYTSPVVVGLRTPIAPVSIPAATTTVQINLPLSDIKAALVSIGFVPPANITIGALIGDTVKTAVVRVLA